MLLYANTRKQGVRKYPARQLIREQRSANSRLLIKVAKPAPRALVVVFCDSELEGACINSNTPSDIRERHNIILRGDSEKCGN